jgi:ABC-type glucose/galactose transport system permease subunit
MSDKTKKALRNLKVGGIYTPIVFGFIFICMTPYFNFIDPSGEIIKKQKEFDSLVPYSTAIGGMLIFFGINSLLYFWKYVKALEHDKKDTV